jgi:uncharacterized protein DUF4339
MADWYYKIAEQVVGPLSAEQLKALADGGRLAPGDPVAKSPEGPWATASRVKGLFEVAAVDDEPEEEATSSGPVPEQAPPAVATEPTPDKEPPIPQPPVVRPTQAPSQAPPQQAAPVGSAPSVGQSPATGGFAIQTEEVATTQRFQKQKTAKKPKEPLTKKQKNARLVKWLAIGIVGGIVLLMSLPYLRDLTRSTPESEVAKDPIAADVDLGNKPDREIDSLEGSFGSSSRAPRSQSSHASGGMPNSAAETPSDTVKQVFQASARAGDIQATPVRVVLDRPRMTNAEGNPARPSSLFLLVEMELSTKSRGVSSRFRGWRNYADEISLTDDRGVEYLVRTPEDFDGVYFVDGQCREMVFVSADEPTTDVIVFAWPEGAPDLPSASEDDLELRLPKAAYGEQGELLFAIPLAEIDVTEEALKKPRNRKPGTSDNVEEDDDGPIRIPGLMN